MKKISITFGFVVVVFFVSACSPSLREETLSAANSSNLIRRSVAVAPVTFSQKYEETLLQSTVSCTATSASDCTQPGCFWLNGACVKIDPQNLISAARAAPLGGIFPLGTSCIFPYSTERDGAKCSGIQASDTKTARENCLATHNCIWVNACSDVLPGAGQTLQEVCELRADCRFVNSACVTAQCTDLDPSACQTRVDCSYSATLNTCVSISCGDIQDPDWCFARNDCNWSATSSDGSTGNCQPSGLSLLDTSRSGCYPVAQVTPQCLSDDLCWTDSTSTPFAGENLGETCYTCVPVDPPCDQIPNSGTCRQISSGAICQTIQNSCLPFKTQDGCNHQKFCEWFSPVGAIAGQCRAKADNPNPGKSSGYPLNACAWDSTNTNYAVNWNTAADICNNSAMCAWDQNAKEADRCHVDLTKSGAADACNAVGLCQWDAASNPADSSCKARLTFAISTAADATNGFCMLGSAPQQSTADKSEVDAFDKLVDSYVTAFTKSHVLCTSMDIEGCGSQSFSCNTSSCTATNANDCANQSGCMWQDSSANCVPDCTSQPGCLLQNGQCSPVAFCETDCDARRRENPNVRCTPSRCIAGYVNNTRESVLSDIQNRMSSPVLAGASSQSCGDNNVLCPLLAPCSHVQDTLNSFSCANHLRKDGCMNAKNINKEATCQWSNNACVPNEGLGSKLCGQIKGQGTKSKPLCSYIPYDSQNPDSNRCVARDDAINSCNVTYGADCQMNTDNTFCNTKQTSADACNGLPGCELNDGTGECENKLIDALTTINQAIGYVPVGMGWWCPQNPFVTASSRCPSHVDQATCQNQAGCLWLNGKCAGTPLPFCPANSCRTQDSQALKCGQCGSSC